MPFYTFQIVFKSGETANVDVTEYVRQAFGEGPVPVKAIWFCNKPIPERMVISAGILVTQNHPLWPGMPPSP